MVPHWNLIGDIGVFMGSVLLKDLNGISLHLPVVKELREIALQLMAF